MALEWVLVALRLNQRPARLRYRHVRGLLWASSSAGKGALSGQTLHWEHDGVRAHVLRQT